MIRIAICAPATPITREVADWVTALAAREFAELKLSFHDQCFAADGHFAGPDSQRLGALLECANDPATDAVWFAKGGYGTIRIAAQALRGMDAAARGKAYLGYSDTGALLAGLYRRGIGRPAHGPMAVDIRRDGGEAAIRRALGWLSGGGAGLEPSLDARPTVAFNLMTLASIAGTGLMPDLSGHVVLIEEVAEHLYAIDRLLYSVTANLKAAGAIGLRLGEVSNVPDNDRPFGSEPEDMVRYWCDRHGLDYLGRAEIGHSAANTVVPFGVAADAARS